MQSITFSVQSSFGKLVAWVRSRSLMRVANPPAPFVGQGNGGKRTGRSRDTDVHVKRLKIVSELNRVKAIFEAKEKAISTKHNEMEAKLKMHECLPAAEKLLNDLENLRTKAQKYLNSKIEEIQDTVAEVFGGQGKQMLHTMFKKC